MQYGYVDENGEITISMPDYTTTFPLPPIDPGLDKLVDSLVEDAYKSFPVTPLRSEPMADKNTVTNKERDNEPESSPVFIGDLIYSTPMVPTYLSTEISMRLDGMTHYLRPKEDLTAYELYNINVWIEEWKLNSLGFKADKFYSRAVELGILRHFESDAPAKHDV